VRRVVLAVAVGLVVGVVPGRAVLYSPDEPMVVPVRPDGTGEALPFDEFRRRYAQLANVADPRPGPDGQPNPDRAKVIARVKARPPAKTAEDDAIACVDLLHLGNTDAGAYVDQALNRLFPRTRERVPNYFAITTLAAVYAARGEWDRAERCHGELRFDAEMPSQVKGWTDAQRGWLQKFDDTYVAHYYRLRRTEAEAKPRPDPEAEEPTPLFPLPSKDGKAAPVRFVNDAGVYEPGVLASAERAKLPPDAIAVTQQMLLLFPGDTRLYWLLAELYAADGKLDEALKILDECAWSRQYGNRRALMEHRAALGTAIVARNEEADRAAAAAYPVSLRTIYVYFGVVVIVGVAAIVRALRKGGPKPGCGPSGCG
jgi:tetratricopeptide (TPR) repeat protein